MSRSNKNQEELGPLPLTTMSRWSRQYSDMPLLIYPRIIKEALGGVSPVQPLGFRHPTFHYPPYARLSVLGRVPRVQKPAATTKKEKKKEDREKMSLFSSRRWRYMHDKSQSHTQIRVIKISKFRQPPLQPRSSFASPLPARRSKSTTRALHWPTELV